jgi:hypothetical protein
MYYESKLKAIIAERWEAHYRAQNPDHEPSKAVPRPTLCFRNEQTRLLYLNETAEVKAEVAAKMKESEDGETSLVEQLEPEDGAESSPDRERITRLVAYRR